MFPRNNPIGTLLKTLRKLKQNSAIRTKITRIIKSDRFNFVAILVLAFFVLATKGVHGEGQGNFLNDLLYNHIIEETSASISAISNKVQLASINSLTLTEVDAKNQSGQGGNESNPILEPANIQDNSLLAFNPADTNYAEMSGFKRSQITEYTVQKGDTVSFIASDFGVSVDSILWANSLKSIHDLSVGQILKIPPVSGVIHKVKTGDKIDAIAKKYGVETDKIVAYNSLPKDGQIQINDELIIPDGKMQSSKTTASVKTAVATQFAYLPNLGNYFMLPATGFNWGKIHGRNGVDIANKTGTPIYAAAEGIVTVADDTGWNGGFGKYIKISHPNGTETLYAHASKLIVAIGQQVGRGQQIALMGSTGRSTGPHLHFEVHGARNPLAK